MAECTTCIAALGTVTNISTGKDGVTKVETVECPECKGYGTLCGRCLKNFDRCSCPEPEQDEPEPKRKEWWE